MTSFKTHFSVILIIALAFWPREGAVIKVKFFNLECEEYDRPFATFEKCYLKAVARDVVSMQLHVALHKTPINNISLHAQLFQRGMGYRPFMYNTTLDFCEFRKKPTRSMFWKIVFDMVSPYTNANHTCPYDHDIIIKDWSLQPDMFKLIPFPENDYMVMLQFGAYNIYRAKVKVYVRIFQ
ncbi:uncharacterized protein LOC106088993 [Stomoxys calcitrans]|uniref:uncharacterized protein LOC106088993 n=1 Tax=Stomoxys calcitrans TaxID=35570 RepID=UPI0027E3718D|nr:uncharacterized protein LOC106088993 [Stomoxys calcitrans]